MLDRMGAGAHTLVVAQRYEAMHVAKVVRKYKDREYASWLLRRSFREAGKVRHETLANLSALPPAAIDALRAVLAGDILVAAGEGLEVERSLPHGHVAAVWAMADKLGLAKLLGPPCPERDLALALVVARRGQARVEAGHHPVVAGDHPGRRCGGGRRVQRRRVRGHGLAGGPPAEVEKALARRHLSPRGRVLYDLSIVVGGRALLPAGGSGPFS